MSHTPSVIVVGAGPTGLLLAGELALAGVRPLVLDRLAAPDPHAPGMALNSTAVELLDQRGLLEDLLPGTIELPLSHFSNIFLDQSSLFGPHRHSVVVAQSRLEERLARWVRELGVEVRRGTEVTGLRQDDGSVTLDVRGEAGEERLTAAYVVAADGAGSTVRRLAGIGFPGTDRTFYGIIGDVRIDSADFRPEHFGAKYSPVGGLFTGTPIGPDLWRIVTSEFGVEPADATAEVTLEELNARTARLTGVEFKNAEVLWLDRTPNPYRLAERYRAGRVFVAGDAAHVFFAFNGQRISSAFQDATNLGWKLAAALNGWAPDGLLDSYEAERLPAGRWAVLNVTAQEAMAEPGESAAALRTLFGELLRFGEVNRFLAETAQGLGVRYPLGGAGEGEEPHPLLGLRLAPVPLVTADGATTSARLLESGRGLLLGLAGKDAAARDAGGWSDRVDVVAAEPSEDVDAAAVLIRPDGHVAWVAPSGPDGGAPDEDGGLRAALARWFGAPTAGTA
jgi:2-polyprenyl-6-methoxyphenol hydroxylase-like FAD-dependent oxidoreductase